ncbi:MAG: YitT family protein [Coprococcus sp.]
MKTVNINFGRTVKSILGVSAAGIGIGMLKRASFGIDPFQIFMIGMDNLIPLSFGTVYLLTGLVLVILSIIFDRKLIGIGTIYTFLCQGYIIDTSTRISAIIFPAPSTFIRVLLFIAGFTILSLATAVYFNASLGVSAYDAISIIMTGRIGFKEFRYNRILTDVICLLSGCLIYLFSGGSLSDIPSFAGIGTILIAIFMGPAVDLFKNLLYDSENMSVHQRNCNPIH